MFILPKYPNAAQATMLCNNTLERNVLWHQMVDMFVARWQRQREGLVLGGVVFFPKNPDRPEDTVEVFQNKLLSIEADSRRTLSPPRYVCIA